MDKEKFLQTGLLEQYVLGLTDEQESAEVERYANAFPEIKAEIEAMREAVEDYARRYDIMPPEELKARLVKDIDSPESPGRGDEATARSAGNARWALWISRGIMALLIVLSLSFYQRKVAVEGKYQALSSAYRAFQQDCARQQAGQERLYAFLNDEHTIPIRLLSTGLVAGAEAIAYFNEGRKEAFINPTRLPAPPAGKAYQVWADVKGEMISMGLIDGHTKQLQAVAFIEGAESLNITLEPEEGSKEPTVSLLYVNAGV